LRRSNLKKTLIFSILAAEIGLSLLGCSHASVVAKEGCQELDWYEIGRRDGSRGLATQNQRTVKVVCEDSDPSLNEALYQNGFDSGVAQFCTASIAFEQGRQHQPNAASSCPLFFREEFSKNYERGAQFANLQQTQKEIARKIENLDQIIKDNSIDQLRREALRLEKNQLESQRRSLEAELSQTSTAKQL
jgi:hypothetical protein